MPIGRRRSRSRLHRPKPARRHSQVQILGSPELPSTYRVKITPAFHIPIATSEIQAQLKAGKLRVDGPTTVDGRKAIKLSSIHGPYGYEYDVAPGTYYPIKQVFRSRAVTITTVYSEYRVLPETPANQSSSARRPPPRRPHRPQPGRLPGRSGATDNRQLTRTTATGELPSCRPMACKGSAPLGAVPTRRTFAPANRRPRRAPRPAAPWLLL